MNAWFRWSYRVSAALGLTALSLTGEMAAGYVAAGWTVWCAALLFDRYPDAQARLRTFENPAVLLLVVAFLIDLFLFDQTFFVGVGHFLILFQIVKLLGPKERKDGMQILLFGFFQMLSAATLSLDAWHGVLLLALIPTGTVGLFWHLVEREKERYGAAMPANAQKAYARITGIMAVAAIPLNLALTLVVFVTFPRLSWNTQLPGFRGHRMGFTDQVNLRQSGRIETNSAAALWLQVEGVDRSAFPGYLRGTTMERFDGERWVSADPRTSHELTSAMHGRYRVPHSGKPRTPARQTVLLLNGSASTFFAAGRPVELQTTARGIRLDANGTLHWSSGAKLPLRYEVLSDLEGDRDLGDDRYYDASSPFLQMPSPPSARMVDLARQAGGTGDIETVARRLELFLRSNYDYSIDQPNVPSGSAVESFLFDRRSGPCGHFASALAMLLRTRGIACRMVAGYLSGEWNEPAQQFLVREKDAHAWVEVYVPEKGWLTLDATPRQLMRAAQRPWFAPLREHWDYLALRWNRFVVEYDLAAQVRAVQEMKRTSDRANARVNGWFSRLFGQKTSGATQGDERTGGPLAAPWVIGGALVLGCAFFLRRTRSARDTDPSIRFYRRFLREMARQGLEKAPAETGWEFAGRVAREKPEKAALARKVTDDYYALRFTRQGNAR